MKMTHMKSLSIFSLCQFTSSILSQTQSNNNRLAYLKALKIDITNLLPMFFKPNKPAASARKPLQPIRSWKLQFKMDLYKQNFRAISQNHPSNLDIESNQPAQSIIQNLRHNRDKYTEGISSQNKITHPFCVYIPLKKNVQLDDEIINTFSYVRNLKEASNFTELDSFYSEIRKFMKYCQDSSKIEKGWQICKQRFIISQDVLRRIELFVQIQKNGTKDLTILHQMFENKSLLEIFMERILATNKYFERESRVNKAWKISVEINDKINEANISKTMKMLYCSICLIYDCGKHKLEEISHKKDHHYSSHKNIIPKPTHISKSIALLKELKNLQSGFFEDCCKQCSQFCFKKLTKKTYTEAELRKSRTISPMIESIIKMGIEMFSYSPCSILSLFPKDSPSLSQVTCSTIFLYLIEQVSLASRLTFKINCNQVEFLRRQCSYEQANLSNLGIIKRKRRAKLMSNQQYRCQQTAICIHSYIGEEVFDNECQNCVCFQRGFCLPECQCSPNCPLMIIGCSCKFKQDCQTAKCKCYQSKMQCIPGICHNCFPSKNASKKNMCINDQILRGCSKEIRIKQSKITGAGFGAYAGCKITKGSLISVYCGQLVDQQMEGIREMLKKDESFYNFACYEGSIDARYMGNKTRFINHGNEGEQKTNLISLNMFSCGQQFIGLYALRDIHQGEELLFDYDVEGEVAKIHSEKYSFLKKTKVQCQ